MNTTTLNTPCGPIKGLERDGIRIFRGITFATCRRFEEPIITTSWEGVYDATNYGTVCPQRSNRLAGIMGNDDGAVVEEGRLCLSIYSPNNAENLPVMVWIHGGSYITGGSEEHRYSGERLVRTGNVVVVKISYRLGALGYLWEPSKGIGNLGLKDQIAGLQWIHDNISAYGGDTENVTLFGQSAGAQSIACMMALSSEKPLFSKVIMQSPSIGVKTSDKKAQKVCRQFLKRLGTDPYKATLNEILDVQESMTKIKTTLPFMPVLEDYDYIPESLVKAGVKVVVGYTDDETAPFVKPLLGKAFETGFGRRIIRYSSRQLFHKPIERYAAILRERGLQTDVYHIHWHPEGSPMGSCHCIELPFLLGHYEDWKDALMLKGLKRDEYERISRFYLEAWTRFAKEGVFTELF